MESIGIKVLNNDNFINLKRKGISNHTHINGLGLDFNGRAIKISSGFVGQEIAREAAGIVVEMVKAKRMSGRAALLVGEPGTGKTAIAFGISKELGEDIPFVPMSGSEVYSAEIKKTEVLMSNVRRAIGIKIKEMKEIYEGEVVKITSIDSEIPFENFNKALSRIDLTLKSSKGTKTIKLDPIFAESIKSEGIKIGDIVYVEGGSGFIKRIGRSESFSQEYDLEIENYVPIPKGDVLKCKEISQKGTLHDLDYANARPEGGSDILSMLETFNKPKKTEITEKLRNEVNTIVNRYIDQGMAELIPGVLFIDEAHMLDLESFIYLTRILESSFSPIIILATNRGICEINGSLGIKSPHGIPKDFLDRTVIIRSSCYNLESMKKIIEIRAKIEEVEFSDDVLSYLGNLAQNHSLRYVIQILTPCKILSIAKTGNLNDNNKGDEITSINLEDVYEITSLFLPTRNQQGLITK